MALFPQYQLIQTQDGLQLPSFLFSSKDSQKVAILIHGNGTTSSFYSYAKLEAYQKALADKSIALFAFDNRGANLVKRYKVQKGDEVIKVLKGTAYERIKECAFDIDAAVLFLKSKGYKEFYLIGESTGANKICVYGWYRPNNEISKYVLVAGSDDLSVYYRMLGEKQFLHLLAVSEEKVKNNQGEVLIPYDQVNGNIISYQAYYDTCNPDGDYNTFPFMEWIENKQLSKNQALFEKLQHINKPILAVYGDKDEFLPGTRDQITELFHKVKGNDSQFHLQWIENADHSFSEQKELLAQYIASWL